MKQNVFQYAATCEASFEAAIEAVATTSVRPPFTQTYPLRSFMTQKIS